MGRCYLQQQINSIDYAHICSKFLKSLLNKGLNFSIPCKKLGYEDYLVQFELFFRDIRHLDILSNEDLDFVRAKTKEAALPFYRSYNSNVPQNLSKEEFIALQNLS